MSEATSAGSVTKNLDIQVIRGIAVILVFLHHVRGHLPEFAAYRWMQRNFDFQVGVDIFFAISGFVITLSLSRMLARGTADKLTAPQFKQFWRNRVARLIPAAFFWAFAAIIAMPFLSTPSGQFNATLASLPFALLNIYNLYFTVCFENNLLGSWCPSYTATHIYWSLSLEMQFYLLFSVGLVFLRLSHLAILAGLVACLSVFIFGDTSDLGAIGKFVYGSFHRGYALILGVLLGVFISGSAAALLSRLSPILIVILASACVVLIAAVPRLLPYYLSNLCIAVLSALLLVLALKGNTFSGFIATSLHWLGERSYSFYLSHTLAIYVIATLARYAGIFETKSEVLQIGLSFVAFAVSLLVADMSYRTVERFGNKR
ncbi:O-acetyltransferase OatA [compost metagenome]